MKPIKQRKMNTWNKRIYIQDKELSLKTNFKPGTKFNAYYVPKLKKIYLVLSNTGNRTVCKRKLNTYTKSVIDIKSMEAMSKLQEHETLKINIFKDNIVIQGWGKDYSAFYNINKDYFSRVSKGNDVLKVISVCSGAGLMDLGFIQEGFEVVYAIEYEKTRADTYRYNIGDHVVCGDLDEVIIEELPDADVLIGGPPCQKYSNSNRSQEFILYSKRNLLIRKYADIAYQKDSLNAFVMENVPQLLTRGKLLVEEFKEHLSEKYHITTQIINSKYFGSPQSRNRAIILGFKPFEISIMNDLSITKFKTVKEAFIGLHDNLSDQQTYPNSSKEVIKRFGEIKQGQNYNDWYGENKRHSNYCKRLIANESSITLVHAAKTLLIHPFEDRVVSIRECARLQDVPDSFIFLGSVVERYQMLANGVTVNMARGLARLIKEKILSTNSNNLSTTY